MQLLIYRKKKSKFMRQMCHRTQNVLETEEKNNTK